MAALYQGLWRMDPNPYPTNPHGHAIHRCGYNSKTGWGTWWDTHWTWDQWVSEFIQQESPSIDYMELFEVLVAMWIWTLDFANKEVRVNSDNQPMVYIINNKSSHSPSMLNLIHFLTLHCMLNNIHLSAQFIPSTLNQRSDALSRLQFSWFHHLMPEANVEPTPLPSFLLPLCASMLNNLYL